MKICLECNQSFLRRKKEAFKRWDSRQYCSHECSNKSLLRIEKCVRYGLIPKSAFKKGQNEREKHPLWKGGKPKCLNCEKQLSTYKVKYCHKHKVKLGKNHHNWKGGVSRDIHSTREPRYRLWRESVFKRDNFKCRIENKDCKGPLQAHHILRWAEYPDLRYVINNGITLCIAHHPRKRAEEKRLIPTFKELVSVSKVQQFV